jgi:hypothetical protein
MDDFTDDKNNGNSYEYHLRSLSNEEIISILRFREHYQKHTVNAVIKEALKRGIINSINDLELDEFQAQPLPPKRLFPIGYTAMQNIAIFKSLCRLFYGFGILPIVYGISLLLGQFFFWGGVAILLGCIIIFMAYKLEKTHHSGYAYFFIALNLPTIAFAVFKLTQHGKPSPIDIFAISIIILVILYTTVYASKLLAHLRKNN